ncbi:hypothetical protein [Aquimarina sp. 433]
MKKITLLLVAAVFAIGIQSCSTEEEVLLEEKVNPKEQQKSLIGLPKLSQNYMYVFFSESISEDKRLELKNLLRKRVYSTLLTYLDKSCSEMETWDVGDYDPVLFAQSGFAALPGGTITAEIDEDEEGTDVEYSLNNNSSIFSIEYIGGYRIVHYRTDIIPEPCPSNDPLLLN